jgi:hypothetical protein
MSKSATLLIGRGAIEARVWGDGEATIASVDAGDGVTAPREDMATALEALAAYVRGGALGPLPVSVKLLVERS